MITFNISATDFCSGNPNVIRMNVFFSHNVNHMESHEWSLCLCDNNFSKLINITELLNLIIKNKNWKKIFLT